MPELNLKAKRYIQNVFEFTISIEVRNSKFIFVKTVMKRKNCIYLQKHRSRWFNAFEPTVDLLLGNKSTSRSGPCWRRPMIDNQQPYTSIDLAGHDSRSPYSNYRQQSVGNGSGEASTVAGLITLACSYSGDTTFVLHRNGVTGRRTEGTLVATRSALEPPIKQILEYYLKTKINITTLF